MWRSSRVSTKPTDYRGSASNTKGIIFKASEVHRSMSGGKIIGQLSQNKGMGKPIVAGKSVRISGNAVKLGSNLATSIAKNAIKQTIKRGIDTGIGF